MGMYTEFIIGFSLKKDTPQDVIDIIKYIVSKKKLHSSSKIKLPNHEFFEEGCNWWEMLKGGSCCFGVCEQLACFKRDSDLHRWFLSIRMNTKNPSQVKEFLDWVKPYIEFGSGYRNFYAIEIHEEAEEPEIYYLGLGSIEQEDEEKKRLGIDGDYNERWLNSIKRGKL